MSREFTLSGVSDLPLDRDRFREVVSRTMPAGKVEINLRAFGRGLEAVRLPSSEKKA